MSELSPAAILYDSTGVNPVGVILDGAVYRLQVLTKVLDSGGSQIDPATEDTLGLIKDTDGIKKITDPLPAGTNNIGDVDVASSALPSGAATETTLAGVKTNQESVIDAGNSSAGQLGNGGNFQGTGVDCIGYSAVAITVHSDQDSAVDGMQFQFSQNDSDWDDSYDWTMDVSDSETRRFQFPITSRYFRVNYTNSTSTTTEFRVQTILHRQNILTSIHRIKDDVYEDRSAQIVKAAIIAQRTGGPTQDFIPIEADPGGNLKVALGIEIPAGDEIIGKVNITDGISDVDVETNNGINRLEGRSSITAPNGVLDVAVIADNSINRLEVRTSVVGQTAGTGAEKKASVIDDIEDSNVKRLQTQALLAPGSTVNIGTSIPADPANLEIRFLEYSGSEDMLVDGSTPVEFSFAPSAGQIIAVESLLIVFTADDFEFDGASFGPKTAMTTGIEFKLTINSTTTTVFTIKQNEDFLRIPGRVPVINNSGPKDLLSAAFVFGGLVKLNGDDGDKISAIVNDDLTSVKFKYLTATMYGAEV